MRVEEMRGEVARGELEEVKSECDLMGDRLTGVTLEEL